MFQVIVPSIQALLKDVFKLNDLQAFRGVLLIFYPGEYVIGALLFLLTLFFIKRDLKRLNAEDQSSLINPLNGDTISQLDEDVGVENRAFKEEASSSNASEEGLNNKLKTK